MASAGDIRDSVERRVAEQEAAIARQRRLIDDLGRAGNGRDLGAARDRLAAMVDELRTLRADARRDEPRPGEGDDPLDEQSLDAVLRDCPL